MSVTRSFSDADSCSIICVDFINQKEVIRQNNSFNRYSFAHISLQILTGNRMGLIKIFDSSADQRQPTTTLMTSCENDKNSNAVTAIAHHPNQTHIVLSGCEEGSITVWDLRQPEYPASYVSAHDTAITEIGFHPTEPVKVYTSSEGGELYQWLSNSNQFTVDGMDSQPNKTEINPWLSGERTKNTISVSLFWRVKKIEFDKMKIFNCSGRHLSVEFISQSIRLVFLARKWYAVQTTKLFIS